jgi:hypothetical protein
MSRQETDPALKAFDKVYSKLDFLSQLMEEYADGLTPGNVAHHRAWFKGQAREIQEIYKECAPHLTTIETALCRYRDAGGAK